MCNYQRQQIELERFPFDVIRGPTCSAAARRPDCGAWTRPGRPALSFAGSSFTGIATTGTKSPADGAGEGATGTRVPTPQPKGAVARPERVAFRHPR